MEVMPTLGAARRSFAAHPTLGFDDAQLPHFFLPCPDSFRTVFADIIQFSSNNHSALGTLMFYNLHYFLQPVQLLGTSCACCAAFPCAGGGSVMSVRNFQQIFDRAPDIGCTVLLHNTSFVGNQGGGLGQSEWTCTDTSAPAMRCILSLLPIAPHAPKDSCLCCRFFCHFVARCLP